jgi:ribosomal protein L11 methyltransferase
MTLGINRDGDSVAGALVKRPRGGAMNGAPPPCGAAGSRPRRERLPHETVSSDYWVLTIALDPEAADAVTNFLWEAGAIGVVEEGTEAPVRLRAFFPAADDPSEATARLARYLDDLRALAVTVGPGTVELAPVAEEVWAEAWRAHFHPLRIGRRLLIAPPWEVPVPDDEDRALVAIEPGRAFGTGGHATTRGCLELLERALDRQPVGHVLDVGTGSGILAIAAARLGVLAVTALDVDPDAVAAARANAERNDVADRLRVELGGPETWTGPPAPLVVANLLGATLVSLAPALGRCCATPGRLVAGGLVVHEAPAIAAAFVPEGFALVEVVEHEGWASLLLAR